MRGVLGARCPVLNDVLLLVSELAANAIRHTASAEADGWFDLTVCIADDTIRVAVGDQGSPTVPQITDGESDADKSTGGRGLRIVDRLADSWGHVGNDTGRVVWFEVKVRAER